MRDPELLQDHGVFIAEGRLVVQRLLQQTRFHIRSVLVTPAALEALHDLQLPSTAEILVAPPDVMSAIATFDVHRGCLALAERGPLPSLDDLLGTSGPLLVLEEVGNPDNVGGAFRNAAAFGASGIVLSPGCADPLYRKSIRTSMAASLTIPFTVAERWPDSLTTVRCGGWSVVALTPSTETELNEALQNLRGSRVAFLLGHEGQGLSDPALRLSSVRAEIPMAAGTDSLNVATAAAVALYAFRFPA